MTAETSALPTAQELIQASQDQLPSLIDRLNGAIKGSCEQTKKNALGIIQVILDTCAPELPLTSALQAILAVQATTYKGSDYTEVHYNF